MQPHLLRTSRHRAKCATKLWRHHPCQLGPMRNQCHGSRTHTHMDCGAFRPVGVAIKDAESGVGARHSWRALDTPTQMWQAAVGKGRGVEGACVYLCNLQLDVAAAVDADAAAACAAADVDNCRMR